jgi:glycosyltransferase involved in cell wall biosynthesis
MNTDFIVDVPMCVYNQEKYIVEAIEGVINQKAHFKYRLIIGEDCYTDNTREIVKRYEAKYPEKIVVIYHNINIGAYENTKTVFKKCTSEYIALCDGDDYWTDPNKLQTQVDFLEKNRNFVGCFHNTEERYEEDSNKPSFLYCNFKSSMAIGFQSLAYHNLIPTCSVVFRKNLIDKIPAWHSTLKMGDWPLHLLNARHGDYWYIPWVMAVHRLHSKSTWNDKRIW